MHTATSLTLAVLLVLTREACGQSTKFEEGDGVAPNETANFTDPQQTSVQFEDNSVETVDDGVVPNVTVNFTDPQQWSEQFEDDSVDASDVSTVVSKPPSSVSPSPVTSSVIVASQPPVKQTEPVEPPFPVDFSSTENSLRTYIFLADKKGAAKVLSRPQLVGLAAGLTYPEELNPLVEPSNQRNEDPDVVAFKAIALSAIFTGEARKLATAAVLSLTPECQCSVFTSEEQDSLIDQFTKDLENRALLQEIIKADANTEFVPEGAKRRLAATGSSPVNSVVCASCWPKETCEPMPWC